MLQQCCLHCTTPVHGAADSHHVARPIDGCPAAADSMPGRALPKRLETAELFQVPAAAGDNCLGTGPPCWPCCQPGEGQAVPTMQVVAATIQGLYTGHLGLPGSMAWRVQRPTWLKPQRPAALKLCQVMLVMSSPWRPASVDGVTTPCWAGYAC
jgi:hypothetical protein